MPADETVLAICVNFNGREVLPATLSSLQSSDYTDLEVVVVDNASTDRSDELVPESVRLLKLGSNLGYAAALNRGLQLPGARDDPGWKPDYYLFLNNDIELHPECISRLVQFARERGPGVFGPKILLKQDARILEAAWGHLDWSHVLARFEGKGASDSGVWNRVRQVDLLLGSVLLVSSAVPARVGLLDEDYFMYHEEVDFLFRVRRAGFPVFYCPFATAVHQAGHSTRGQPLRKTRWLRRNTVLFMRKHGASPWQWLWWASTLSLSVLYHLVRFRMARLGAIVTGIREGFAAEVRRDT